MKISKAIEPIILALGGQASEIRGKSLSKVISYMSPLFESFINDPVKTNGIATSNIKDGAVSTNKIKAKAVTEDKISDELSEKINAGGGAGGNDFVVTYTPGPTFNCNKTLSEILEANDAGKRVIAIDGGGNNYILGGFSKAPGSEYVDFYNITRLNGTGSSAALAAHNIRHYNSDGSEHIDYVSKTLS